MRSIVVAAAAALWLASTTAQATSIVATLPVFYTDEASFLAAAASARITLTEETVENLTYPTVQSLTQLASGLNVQSNTALFPHSGNFCWGQSGCMLLVNPVEGSRLTFTFDARTMNAFGFHTGDLGDVGPTTFTLQTPQGSASYVFHYQADSNHKFFGVINTHRAFNQVVVTGSAPGDAVGFDQFRFGKVSPVPEPSAILLMLAGALAAGVAAHRRRAG
ncbi:PEP-CTERM sorting domain-containing protein [Aquabacterium lacunae]|uniref:PEP-CTERM sorting domain-containing protein n=1 Tax=Aquabacterium lacunae TaxID=2528630 RepID=A0A4Q9H1G0_9BURK|nr:PEP-CTERM sorting domain-containing protein [Aquabacterium lacunae]TBO28301.1 PEP-CTERM sorting domain-containing protein [Aquabacterium lacunae]